jgi:hypothetical protein
LSELAGLARFAPLIDVYRMPRRLIIALLFAVLVPALAAQRGGFRGGGFQGGFSRGNGLGWRGNGFGPGAAFWGDPYFYADFPYQSLSYQQPAPPVVVVQQTAAPAPSEPERDAQSLMIEWRGDRYVRSVGGQPSGPEDYAKTPVSPSAFSTAQDRPTVRIELPPAILVYRDGHREKVSDYVIESGNLYAHGNYWTDGYWNKTVQLAALDIPATLKVNQQRGVKFVLPSEPNEVVTRP